MTQDQSRSRRLKLAAVVTAFAEMLHPQEILGRFFDGYGWNGRIHHPNMDVVALYVDQRGAGDLTRSFTQRFPLLKVYPTIADAVTLGTGKLAVDGVVAVGEHGAYPRSALGQDEQPHYRLFASVVDVYRSSGHAVPYFNDKQLASWSWENSKRMVDTSKELRFALQGGSSLPVTWRIPSLEFPDGVRVREAMSVAYGPPDSYDFHGLATIQCMVERRQGGESGVEWVEAYRGDRFWDAYARGVWPHELVMACLARSFTIKPGFRLYNSAYPTIAAMKALVPDPVAYRYQHRDGLTCTMILLYGLVNDMTFAADIVGQAKPFSTQMYLPMPVGGRTTLASFFSPLVNNAEIMFETGRATYPVERILLTTGLTIAGVNSLAQGQQRLPTPELAAVQYQPFPHSVYQRS